MNITLACIIITIYFVVLLFIFSYSLTHLNLLINYLKFRKKPKTGVTFDLDNPEEVPSVTIQLPIYNEVYVVERLLEAISKLDYPHEKLYVQVLDDSTDGSKARNIILAENLAKTGFPIAHVTREGRKDFKAGALREGLKTCKGDFVAIFDADFVPDENWLKKTVIYFKDPQIGVVQTRWGHLNRSYSLLTRSQAMALDAHFTLEQVGRNSKGHFINFNGTAGIWRTSCILDSGNWQGDTLTEDLDLSYRAQLKGWKFKYLEELETPAELPVAISAARSQQFRWNKGGAENFRKLAWKVLTSKHLPLKTRLHCFVHLLSSSMFLSITLLSLLSVPMLYIKNQFASLGVFFDIMGLFTVSTVILFVCYWFPFKNIQGGGFEKFIEYIGLFFTFFTIALGFSFHNSVAVLLGHVGKKSEFVRTPKFNLKTLKDSWKSNIYITKKVSPYVVIEVLLAAYFLFGLYSGIVLNNYGLFPFHMMLFIGYAYVVYNSVFSRK